MNKPMVLLGDESLGLGAIHAGLSGVYGYPGTPSTEIFEFVEGLAEEWQLHARWSSNEKVAYEEALGMSYAGRRALVTMKHVGLNVAADPFINSAVTGVRGGLVLAVADDPGMHSSQNEQDSRVFSEFAKLPVLEPRNHQQCYDMARYAFELSEQVRLPVVLRMVTRLAHSRSSVQPREAAPQNPVWQGERDNHWTLLPTYARGHFRELLGKEQRLVELSERSPYNTYDDGPADVSLGIVSSGLGTNYYLEAVGGRSPWPHLSVGFYPAPAGLLRTIYDRCERILFIEEGYPYLEARCRGLLAHAPERLLGKQDGTLPSSGELNPDIVAAAIGRKSATVHQKVELPARPPQLCAGCPHADTFRAMKQALEGYRNPFVATDIGCYTLGFYPPYDTGDSCVCMGASITMASGASHAGIHPALCVIGDSTFMHSGMTGLAGAVRDNNNMTVFILDNGTVAMTGKQESMASGERLDRVVAGLGVAPEHLRVLNPLPKHLAENAAVIRQEIEYRGLSVIIARRPCIQVRAGKSA